MIINNEQQSEVFSTGVQNSIKMGIDKLDEGVLMRILSEGLYSDPIGSMIREWVSNALDANREAGNEEPIIVSLKEDNNKKWWFKVQDFGVGMSPDRVKNVITKYAASTKRNDANQLGFFGLGLKSGLSYADSFNIETNFDGVKYFYMMYKGEKETMFDLLNEQPTDEGNGTTISIQLKNDREYNYSWSKPNDYKTFLGKMREQLSYFHGVFFQVDDIPNDFEIIEGVDWKYSSLITTANMHLCLDDVYYAIDWEKLGIPAIEFPVGLKFKVTDGLIPTPNRESILLTPSVKKMILDKIGLVATYFISEYNNTVAEFDNIISAWEYIGKEEKKYILKSNAHSVQLNVVKLKKYSKTEIQKVTIKGIDILNLDKNLKAHIEDYALQVEARGGISNHWTKGMSYSSKIERTSSSIFKDIVRGRDNYHKYILCKEKPTSLLIDYIKDTIGESLFVYKIDRKAYLFEMHYGRLNTSGGSLYAILELWTIDRSLWRKAINEYILIKEQLINAFIKIETIIPTQVWLDQRKANRAKNTRIAIQKEEISGKVFYMGNRGATTDEGFKEDITKLHKMKSYYIYGWDKDKMKQLYDTLYDRYGRITHKDKTKFVLLCMRDYKKMETKTIHNWISIDKFMEGKNKTFGRYCTATLVYNFLKEKNSIISRLPFIKTLSTTLYDDIKKLQDYKEDFGYIYNNDDLAKDMVKVCSDGDLYDKSALNLLNSVKERIEPFDFIPLLSDYDTDGEKKLAIEVLKGRKVKLNINCYKDAAKEKEEVSFAGIFPEEEEESIDFPTDEEIEENDVQQTEIVIENDEPF